VVPAGERVSPDEEEEGARRPRLTAVKDRRLEVPADTLLCSLEHEIRVVEL
jgi:hypothetical protein